MKNKNIRCNRMENGVQVKLNEHNNDASISEEKQKTNNLRKSFSPRPNYNNSIISNDLALTTERSRKLILHFDVRNTVLVADSVTAIGVEQALNSYLTGVTWGYETEDGDWKWVSDLPSLNAPQPDCKTYYKHLEAKLVRTPTDRGMLRQQTGDFTQEELGEKFLPYFETALDNFEWKHEKTDSKLSMQGKNGKFYHYILPSVFQLIQYLHDTKRDFALVIRTYGMDAPNVLRAIDHSIQGNHPDFKHLPKNIKVDHTCGHIKRHNSGSIAIKIPHESDDSKSVVLTDERNIYKFLSEKKGVCAFVDDFLFWQKNNYSTVCGKPLWVDPQDNSVQHIFFDDNIRLTDRDSIVDLRSLERSQTSIRNSLTSPKPLKRPSLRHKFSSQTSIDVINVDDKNKYEDMCLVHADLLQSTKDINYFVEKVKLCEQNYSKFLKEST